MSQNASALRLARTILHHGLAAACCLLVFSSMGCHVMNSHLANRVGLEQFRRGNYTAACANFTAAAMENPENPTFLANLAASLRHSGNSALAEQTYRQALNLDPAHQPSYHGISQLLKDQGRVAEASSLLSGWAATQPWSPEPHVELAWLQREQGDLGGATASLQRALRVKPDHPTALAHLGQVYQDSGNFNGALAMYQRSLMSNWNQPKVQSRMAALRNGRPATFADRGPAVPGQLAAAPSPNRVSWQPAGVGLQNGVAARPAYPPYPQFSSRHGGFFGAPQNAMVPWTAGYPQAIPMPMTAGVPVMDSLPMTASRPTTTSSFPTQVAPAMSENDGAANRLATRPDGGPRTVVTQPAPRTAVAPAEPAPVNTAPANTSPANTAPATSPANSGVVPFPTADPQTTVPAPVNPMSASPMPDQPAASVPAAAVPMSPAGPEAAGFPAGPIPPAAPGMPAEPMPADGATAPEVSPF